MLPCHYMSIIITFFATCKVIPFTRKFLGAFWRKYIRHSSYKILRQKTPILLWSQIKFSKTEIRALWSEMKFRVFLQKLFIEKF